MGAYPRGSMLERLCASKRKTLVKLVEEIGESEEWLRRTMVENRQKQLDDLTIEELGAFISKADDMLFQHALRYRLH